MQATPSLKADAPRPDFRRQHTGFLMPLGHDDPDPLKPPAHNALNTACLRDASAPPFAFKSGHAIDVAAAIEVDQGIEGEQVVAVVGRCEEHDQDVVAARQR